jgi:hypothetical protein
MSTPAAEEFWDQLRRAAEDRDYLSAYRAVKDLHKALARDCAAKCGRKAMADGIHCIVCWSKTPACGAMLGRIEKDVTRALNAVERDDLERSIVATVYAESDAALPAQADSAPEQSEAIVAAPIRDAARRSTAPIGRRRTRP